MYWEEDKQTGTNYIIDDVVDLVFGIECKSLPVDHMLALSESILKILPWLQEEPMAGIHSIHVAASGNGWIRPEDPDALLHLSRRTRMELRVPQHRIDDTRQLEGKTLVVGENRVKVKNATVRPMSTLTTLFCRHLATEDNIVDEEQVLNGVAAQMNALGIKPRKMMCGTEHVIRAPEGAIRARSLMLADLEVEDSLILQKQGLGPHRVMGCGLFIPHRHINDLREESA